MTNLGAIKDIDQLWLLLSQKYSEPHRYYHNDIHITRCLKTLDDIIYTKDFSDVSPYELEDIEACIWFHDVIYNIGDSANEFKSSSWTVYHLDKCGVDFKRAKRIGDLINSTHIESYIKEFDEYIVHDIDYAGLGDPWEVFIEDRNNIKKEYMTVFDEERVEYGMLQFLKNLHDKEFIFYIKEFYHIEEQAYNNIRRFLGDVI